MAAKRCSEDHVEILYWVRNCPLCMALDSAMGLLDDIGFDPDAPPKKDKKKKKHKNKKLGNLLMFPNNKKGNTHDFKG